MCNDDWNIEHRCGQKDALLRSNNIKNHIQINFRVFRPSHQTSSQPEEEFNQVGWPDSWTKTSDSDNVRNFSAICLLYAKYLTQILGNKVTCLFIRCRMKALHKMTTRPPPHNWSFNQSVSFGLIAFLWLTDVWMIYFYVNFLFILVKI